MGLNLNMFHLSLFYFYCGNVGHRERTCARRKEDSRNSELYERLFGEWLRVVIRRGLIESRA